MSETYSEARDDMIARLAEVEQRANAATEAPWLAVGAAIARAGTRHPLGSVLSHADRQFIAHGREDVPWLTEQVRMLLRRVARLTAHQKAGDEGYEQLAAEHAEAKTALARVAGLHTPDPLDPSWCKEDGFIWPCSTAQALAISGEVVAAGKNAMRQQSERDGGQPGNAEPKPATDAATPAQTTSPAKTNEVCE